MRYPDSLVTYNVGPRRPWRITRSLRQIVRDEQPDAIALFEAGRALHRIRRKFARGWELYATDDVVLLVRKGLEQPTVRPAGHNVVWWGPKEGIKHAGREHLVATWAGVMRWTLMHGVPGGIWGGVGPHLSRPGKRYGRNRPAWKADGKAVRKPIRNFEGARLLAGDLNATAVQLAARFERLGLRNVPTNANVDHVAEAGFEQVDATRLSNYGSDHPAVRVDLVLGEAA